MRLRYLPTAEFGLRWMRRYYRSQPQLDVVAVSAALAIAEQNILTHPESAARFENLDRVREYHIRGTPFSLLYAVMPDQVVVIDVRDVRGQRSAEILRKFLEDIGASPTDA
ncbi:hypothetical protein ASE36_11340 [Rhizobium sp. Root274]|uniref:hypothetical protein n=1 Tax=unclassified Rhizobium TaxID=2613769 RepID=UPI0007145813|nr:MULTISPECIES: hypothetical protein [unclassified Rhizobium]KQW29061.1 hypothetical protein ASC71_11360 [Rhizobium sp. Root1240]KRD29258.1 hypothetical protein ASE36_11340 [Rhizobium sp. Root274]